MGLHRRKSGDYFYRSRRRGRSVEKVYIGGGALGEFAAQAERLRLHELEEERHKWERQKQLINSALTAFQELDSGADLMRDATLLAAGFHRADRRPWRPWRHGRRVLKQLD